MVIGLIIGMWNRLTMYLQDIYTTGPLSSYYRKKINVTVFPHWSIKADYYRCDFTFSSISTNLNIILFYIILHYVTLYNWWFVHNW